MPVEPESYFLWTTSIKYEEVYLKFIDQIRDDKFQWQCCGNLHLLKNSEDKIVPIMTK